MRIARALPMITLLTFATPALAAEEYVIMKVGSQDISSAEAQRFWEGLFPQGGAPAFDTVKPDIRDKILRGVMAERVLVSEAQKQGLDKSDAVLRQVEEMKRKVVVRALIDSKVSDNVSEADLKKEYDTMLSATKNEHEVRARHILVQSEAEAKDAKKKLDEGKSFEEVAKNLSKDAGSAKQGGDLGYFTRDKMVKEFGDTAFSMKKGEISAPVKSSFGWHVIKVEDIRNVTPPAFAEVKNSLRAKLQEKKLNDYLSGLIKNADVKVFDAKGKQIAFDKNAEPQPISGKAEKKPEKEKPAKIEKTEKPVEKTTEKPVEKAAEKPAAKPETPKAESAEKPAEKSSEKSSEKTESAH